MDVDALLEELFAARRALLGELLAAKPFLGVKGDLAAKIGIPPNYLSRLLSTKDGAKKIGEVIALRIELQLDLEPGAMLNPLAATAITRPRKVTGGERSVFSQELQAALSALSAPDVLTAENVLRAHLKLPHLAAPARRKQRGKAA